MTTKPRRIVDMANQEVECALVFACAIAAGRGETMPPSVVAALANVTALYARQDRRARDGEAAVQPGDRWTCSTCKHFRLRPPTAICALRERETTAVSGCRQWVEVER